MVNQKKYTVFGLLVAAVLSSLLFSCGMARSGKRSPAGGGSYKKADRSYLFKKSKDFSGRNKSDGTKGFAHTGKKAAAARMVIYTAHYMIFVESVPSSMKNIKTLISSVKGFLEKAHTSDTYRSAYLILRVPVAAFDSTLNKLEAIGTVMKRSVSASDVTKEYSDVNLRIKTARRVRDRLYALLKRTKKVKEKIRILKEIERLTLKIDTLISRRAFLKNRADYSTIYVRLRALVRQIATRPIKSPFPWIASLKMNRRSIFKSSGIAYNKPNGYFYWEKKFKKQRNDFLFTTPGGAKSGIRIGVVKNEPAANLEFWEQAFSRDLLEKKYIIKNKERLQQNNRQYVKYEIKMGKAIYLVAFSVEQKKLLIIEARFSNKESYNTYGKRINSFIKSVRVD